MDLTSQLYKIIYINNQEVFDPSNLQNRDYYDILDNESKDYSSTHRIVLL